MNIKDRLKVCMCSQLALALLAACTSGDDLENNLLPTGQQLTINAVNGEGGSRTIFTETSDKVTAAWSSKDKVIVLTGDNTNSVNNMAVFSVSPQSSNTHYATLSGSVENEIAEGDVVSGVISTQYITTDGLVNSNKQISVEYSEQKGTFEDAMSHCLQIGTTKYPGGDIIPDMTFGYKTSFFKLALDFNDVSLSGTAQLTLTADNLVNKSFINTVYNGGGGFNTNTEVKGDIRISDVNVANGEATVWMALKPAEMKNVVLTAVVNDEVYKFAVSGDKTASIAAGKVYAFSRTGEKGTVADLMNGDGTPENPYQITDLTQLALVRNQINSGLKDFNAKSYVLMSDVEINGEWIPIGSSINPFRGSFDGGNHSVSGNYSVNGLEQNYGAGLFGVISNATVKNISNNANITATIGSNSQNGTGGVVGRVLYGSTVENCSNSGTITSSSQHVGGVVGLVYVNGTDLSDMKTAKIEACWNNGKIKNESSIDASKDAGGVVGYLQTANENVTDLIIVRGCYSTLSSSVELTAAKAAFAGGVVGYTNNKAKNVIDIYACWSAATLKGNTNAAIVTGNSTNLFSVHDTWRKSVSGINATNVTNNLSGKNNNASTDVPGSQAITYMNDALSAASSAYKYDNKGNITK